MLQNNVQKFNINIFTLIQKPGINGSLIITIHP